MPLIFLVAVVAGWLQIVAADADARRGFFNGLLGTICWCLGITLAELFAGIEDTLPPSSSGAQKRRKNQASHEPRPPSAATLKRAETMRKKKLAQQSTATAKRVRSV